MKRPTSFLAVLIMSILLTVCFSGSVFAEPGIAGRFGVFHEQINQDIARAAEKVLQDWLVPYPVEDTSTSLGENVLAPPANDNFINRINLTGSTGSAVVNNTSATFEPGEPFHFPFGFGQNTIWYSWTAPSSGTFGFDTRDSAIPALVAIYQGSSLTSLTSVESAGFYFYSGITAQSGMEYQIAVMGAFATIEGITNLRYYPDSIGGVTNIFNVPARYPLMVPAPDGSIAYTIAEVLVKISSPTNQYGYPVNPLFKYEIYPEGLNIYDRKNTGVVLNAQPDDAGTQYMLLDYDGKQVLLYNQITQKVLLYRLTKQGLTKVGETVVADVTGGKMQGSYIYINQGLSEGFDIIQFPSAVQAFDKRLKKLKWQLPYEKGPIYLHTKTGYVYRHYTGPYTQEIVGYKKGKEQNRSHIDYSFTGLTQVQTDPIGNMLYWYEHGPHPFRTNSPLTYISRKGEELFSNQTLPDVGNTWAFGGFEKKRMYVVRPNGTEQIATGYKFSKTISQTGNQPVTGFGEAKLYDSILTVFRSVGPGTQGFKQFDKNIRKETWNEPSSLGYVEYIGKGVFGRMQTVLGPGSTNQILRIFNRKKKIADHQVTM